MSDIYIYMNGNSNSYKQLLLLNPQTFCRLFCSSIVVIPRLYICDVSSFLYLPLMLATHTQRPHIRRPPIASSIPRNLQYRYLPEHRTSSQSGQHGGSIISHHRQSPSLHNIHLLADVTFATNIVTRTEHLRKEIMRCSYEINITILVIKRIPAI